MIRPNQAAVGRTLAAASMMRMSAPGATLDRAEGHQQGLGLAEADDLGGQRGLAAPLDLGARADGEAGQSAARLDQQTADARHLAGDDQRVDRFDGGDEIAQRGPLGRKRRSRSTPSCPIMVNGR